METVIAVSGEAPVEADPSMQWEAIPSGRRGRQQSYSDAAIQACLTLKVLLGRTGKPGPPHPPHRSSRDHPMAASGPGMDRGDRLPRAIIIKPLN